MSTLARAAVALLLVTHLACGAELERAPQTDGPPVDSPDAGHPDGDEPDAGDADGGDPGPPCPGDVPAELDLHPFYKKYCDADGIAIIGSWRVADEAFAVAADIVRHMLSAREDLHARLVRVGARVAIMAETEVTTDIPEHAYLADDPVTDWDERARGLGGTLHLPLTSCGEENLLCRPTDRYLGENILVHEFAHTLHLVGLDWEEPSFSTELRAAYTDAMLDGLWQNTYAAVNEREYFAEGVQSFFDADRATDPPDGIHNHVATRALLETYDPVLHDLIERVFPGVSWRPRCP